MINQEATRIITEVLTYSGNSEIQVHETTYQSDYYIKAKVSYVWYLNGHRKEVSNVEQTAYIDNSGKWKTF